MDDDKKLQEGGDQTSKKRKAKHIAEDSQPSTSTVNIVENFGENEQNKSAWVPSLAPKRVTDFRQEMESLGFEEELYALHEIALDPTFKIENLAKDPITTVVEKEMKRAYWDILKEELQKDPPVYEHAFKLLLEVKEFAREKIIFRTSTGAGAQTIMKQLEAIIDENTLKNQIEQGVFDFQVVVRNICDVFAKLCSPARDIEVEDLRKETNMFLALKGTFLLMENIEKDITNFFISIGHPDIVKQAQAKELQYYLSKRSQVGDTGVRQWLKVSMAEAARPVSTDDLSSSPGSRSPSYKRIAEDIEEKVKRITSRGYVRLIETEAPDPFPETMRLDTMRLAAFAEKFLQLDICTASITFDAAGKEFAKKQGSFLKNNLIIISNDIEVSNLGVVVEKLGEQCVKEVREWAESDETSAEALSKLDSLRQQILGLKQLDNPVRKLVHSRVARLVESIIAGTWNQEFPSVLAPVQLQLTAFAYKFAQICAYNRNTFVDVYAALIKELEENNIPHGVN